MKSRDLMVAAFFMCPIVVLACYIYIKKSENTQSDTKDVNRIK